MTCSRRPGRGLGIRIILVAAICLGGHFVGAWAWSEIAEAGSACVSPTYPSLLFDDVRGVRTKWLSLSPDARNTIQPDLAGLRLKDWMNNLESAGVNLAEINLEPVNQLSNEPWLSNEDLLRMSGATYVPEAERANSERTQLLQFEQDIVPNRKYTADQRNLVLLDFLSRLEQLRRGGQISGSVRFIMHQRLWFRAGNGKKANYKRDLHAEEFAQDMSSFIDLAKQNCLEHWLAGVRLGEHSNNRMNQLLPIIVDLAHRINARTGGWLQTHAFLVNGGGWGAEYKGIDRVPAEDGGLYPFFPRLAAEVGAFAFGYKWMQFHDRIGFGIEGHLAATECAPTRACDPRSVADWRWYLDEELGFGDLVSFIAANRNRYPALANVVFVGDDSDSVDEMVMTDRANRLEDRPPMVALRLLFENAGRAGWRGRIFMNGYNTAQTMRHFNEGGPVDIGRSLFFVDAKGRARLLPDSKRLWDDWPGS